MANIKKNGSEMCEHCKYAIWEDGVVVDCRKDLPEPKWDDYEECYDCEEFRGRSYHEAVMTNEEIAREIRADMVYDEIRDRGIC